MQVRQGATLDNSGNNLGSGEMTRLSDKAGVEWTGCT